MAHRPGHAVTDDPWATVSGSRQLLAVARTMTSAVGLMEPLSLLGDDPRVGVSFTVVPGSEFSGSAADRFGSLGARILPWREALRHPFDLAVTASLNGALHRLRAPILALPHGAGFNKWLLTTDGVVESAVGGLSTAQLVHRGRVVPAAIGLQHDTQRERLAVQCPSAVDRSHVVGDPCFDRMSASAGRRALYREALGVQPWHRLVVLSSTFRGGSLFATWPGLAHALVREAPVDRWRVALVLHPNVWDRHGAFEVRRWTERAQAAGLLVIPPEQGWQAALVAADAVVGDHGSVTLYAAALGRPTALGAFAAEEIDPGSAMAGLARQVPRLAPDGPLVPQLERLIATHDPAWGRRVRDGAFGMVGEAHARLRALLYGLLRLPAPPDPPPLHALPVPSVDDSRPMALRVTGQVAAGRSSNAAVTVALRRLPMGGDDGEESDVPRHLAVAEDEPNLRWSESAAVVVRSPHLRPPGGATPTDALSWAEDTLARYPGSDIAAAPLADGRHLLRLRDGRALFVAAVSEPPRSAHGWRPDTSACASAVFCCLSALQLDVAVRHGLRVGAGGRCAQLHLEWLTVSQARATEHPVGPV